MKNNSSISKWLVFCLLAMSMLLTSCGTFPASVAPDMSSTAKGHIEAVYEYVTAVDTLDTNALFDLYSPSMQAAFGSSMSEEQEKNRVGILSVETIDIEEYKTVSAEDANNLNPYVDSYDASDLVDLEYLYVGFCLTVVKQTDIWNDGVLYQVMKVGRDSSGDYRIAGMENVWNFGYAQETGIAFNSESEKTASVAWKRRQDGEMVNNAGFLFRYDEETITE